MNEVKNVFFFLFNLISLEYFFLLILWVCLFYFVAQILLSISLATPRSRLSCLAWKTNRIYYLRIYFASPTFEQGRRGKREKVLEKLLMLVYPLLSYFYFISVLTPLQPYGSIIHI